MQQPRSAAAAHLGHQPRRGRVHREHVVAVDLRGRDAQRFGTRRGTFARGHRAARGGRAPAVVLADEQHRQLVHAGPVQRLEEGAAVDRAVAEEADRERVALAQHLLRMRRAHRDRQPGRHHAVGAQHADREIGDVHRAALAAVEARGLAEQLAHHACEVGALGQRVAVAAVGGREVVARAQVRADAGRHRLLPGRQVQRPAHLGRAAGLLPIGAHAALAGRLGRVLERADAHHGAVQRLGGAAGDVQVHLVSDACGMGVCGKIVSSVTDWGQGLSRGPRSPGMRSPRASGSQGRRTRKVPSLKGATVYGSSVYFVTTGAQSTSGRSSSRKASCEQSLSYTVHRRAPSSLISR